MLEQLKQEVYLANMELNIRKLVTYTWGNASGIDREKGLVVIKPSGVDYEKLSPDNMVVVDLEGKVVEGDFNPSSDTATHVVLYKNMPNVGGIVHTHSRYATIFSQAGMPIIPLGTTHADYYYGEIPVTRVLSDDEINNDYELNTGNVILETFKNLNPLEVPAVLVNNHAPFTFGKNATDAVYHCVVLEEVAMMALNTMLLNPNIKSIKQSILDKHYLRKHGKNAYYGQK